MNARRVSPFDLRCLFSVKSAENNSISHKPKRIKFPCSAVYNMESNGAKFRVPTLLFTYIGEAELERQSKTTPRLDNVLDGYTVRHRNVLQSCLLYNGTHSLGAGSATIPFPPHPEKNIPAYQRLHRKFLNLWYRVSSIDAATVSLHFDSLSKLLH